MANHLSWLDIPLIASKSDVVFVSMAELKHWPWIGLMARSLGTILIERAQRRGLPQVHEEIRRARERGESVVFFPEGRIGSGLEALRFRPALFEVAAQRGDPVCCVALSYQTGPSDEPAQHSVVWGQRAFLAQAWSLLLQSRIEASLQITHAGIRGTDRKSLAEACERSVGGALGQSSTDERAAADRVEV